MAYLRRLGATHYELQTIMKHPDFVKDPLAALRVPQTNETSPGPKKSQTSVSNEEIEDKNSIKKVEAAISPLGSTESISEQ